MLDRNIWNHLTQWQKKAQTHLKMFSTKCVYKSCIYLIYMYKEDSTLDNLRWLIRQKTQAIPTKANLVWYLGSIKHECLVSIPDIDMIVRVFANRPGDLGSIPSRVISKTQKMILDISLLINQRYKVRTKGRVEQSRERVAPSPIRWCSSYRKGSLRVTLD